MKWITRSHVHVARVACPWLISRFIDSTAEFLFVPNNQIDKVAQETGAIAFDAPGVELGHHAGRCSFEAIARGYGLRFPDDLENLQHQFEVYDALYAWCRLDVAAK